MTSLCLAETTYRDTRVACQLDHGHDGEHEVRFATGQTVAWWRAGLIKTSERERP